MSRVLRTDAPAKVNWTLEVLRRRADGYHDIASVMSAISLHDELTLTPAADWRVTVAAPEPLRAELERGGVNLVQRAAEAACLTVRQSAPAAHLHLVKHITAAAGLGGGSSDAAAALRLLAAYWREVAPPAGRALRARMHEVAAALGSDVPFFLRGGTQLATGRGDRLLALPNRTPRAWLVLLTPPIQIERKTARLYASLSPDALTAGEASRLLWSRLTVDRLPASEAQLCNSFERAATREFAGLERYRQVLTEAAAAPAHLCGAGPTLFALVPDGRRAAAAARRLQRDGYSALAAQSIGPRTSARIRIADV